MVCPASARGKVTAEKKSFKAYSAEPNGNRLDTLDVIDVARLCLLPRKAAERAALVRKREISAESPPGFGVRQCPAAFGGCALKPISDCKNKSLGRRSKTHNVLSFFCSIAKRRSTAALHNASEK